MLRWLCFLFIHLSVQAAEPKISEFTLDNGLKLLVQEDHRAPVAVTQVWYKVGASYEHGGITGISHMLEHMMFKGTEKHSPGEFSRIIAANGGSENAFTADDYTAYFQTLEKNRLNISFELEADRMRNLKLLQDEFIKEQQVVLEERRLRTDDQPRAKLEEHFKAQAFSNSPYHNPVIGWPDDVAGLKVSDLENWYRLWYAPNNATLVVVGDVEPLAVLNLAKNYFADLKPSQLPEIKPQTEVIQLGERKMTVQLPAKLPYLMMGYKTPSLNSGTNEWEAYALEVAAGILDQGNSARLASHLVRGKQIAASANASYGITDRLSTLFTLEGTPSSGKSVQSLEKALRDEIRQLQEATVSEIELERIKAQILASHIYQRDSIFYQAMQLGVAETVGLGWRAVDDYVKKIEAVTPDQIKQVAQKYLIDASLSVAYLDPLPLSEDKKRVEERMGDQHVR